MKRNGCVYGIICIIVVLLISFQAVYASRVGYFPPNTIEIKTEREENSKKDNLLYKKWCKETFENGEYIYEAYKYIAFNIKYTPESYKTDYWQTPKKTREIKKGDCEDAVFLFFSQLLPNQKNAEIVWGWVIGIQDLVGRAHVWYQLTDKRGNVYIVEGFSKDWNGIIPMEIVKEDEERRSILKVSNIELNSLLCLASAFDSLEKFMELANLRTKRDFIRYRGAIDYAVTRYAYITNLRFDSVLPIFESQKDNRSSDKEIHDIFRKLDELFSRWN